MNQFAFLGAPICAGSPSDGSQYAFEALTPMLRGIFGARARFVPMRPSDQAGLSSPPGLRSLYEVMDIARRLYRGVAAALEAGDFPIVIGGDHSLAIGSMAAVAEHVSPTALSVAWIDGHTDINTEKTSLSGCIHGMPLAQALGLCTPALSVGSERVHLYGENLTILGARSIDAGEYPIIKENGVSLITADEIRARSVESVMNAVLHRIRTPYLHISFDVDCMDGSLFPATGYQMPFGMTKHEAFHSLLTLLSSGKAVSLDIVEYNPLLDPDRTSLAILEALFSDIASLPPEYFPLMR